MDFTVLVGGAAGQGMDTFSNLLELTMKRFGYHVFSYKNYMSMVRGGHNFIQVRFSDKPISTFTTKVDVIFALNEETINNHKDKLKENGVIIADKDILKDNNILHLPIMDVAKELGNNKIYPTIGLGAILKYFGLSLDISEDIIKEELIEKIAEINIKALHGGYELLEERFKLEKNKDENILINGNQAVALGAIAAGCKFYCGYPMTPSTSILTYLSKKSNELGIMIDQVEDEVAALNMALGASYAGVRAMTGSSGGGFALMVEALSLAGIIETPVVVINVQRPGPATGLSTRTEQSDLRFLIHAGHGEFPRMVISLRSPEDAFYQTARAFNLADKYQIPVLLISDEYLADLTLSTKPFDFSKISIERNIAKVEDITDERYKRYKFTDSGISPRLIPGMDPNHLVLVDSHEHNEYGNIDEDPINRIKMVDKRSKKFELLKTEVQEPWFIGEENPENLIVCWGSTYGAVKESVDRLRKEGISIGALIYGDIWPFPTKKLLEVSKRTKKIINIEQNSTGQLESLINEKTSVKCTDRILKYDGRALNSDEICEKLGEIL